jgi:hypothetical protein
MWGGTTASAKAQKKLAIRAGLAGALAVAVLATLSSQAQASGTGKITATGTVICPSVAGSVRFLPPLTGSGSVNHERVSLVLTLSGCGLSGSNIPSVTGKVLRVNISYRGAKANSCASLARGNAPSRAKAGWMGPNGTVVRPSLFNMTGETWNTHSPQLVLQMPGSENSSSSRHPNRSFSGRDHGGSSSVALTFRVTGAQFAIDCSGGTNKLSASTVTSGSVTVG